MSVYGETLHRWLGRDSSAERRGFESHPRRRWSFFPHNNK